MESTNTLRFSGFFQGYEIGTLARNGLSISSKLFAKEKTELRLAIVLLGIHRTFTFSKSTIETLEKGVKYVQS